MAAGPALSIDPILDLEAHLEVDLTVHHLTTVMILDTLEGTDTLAQDHILDLVADLGQDLIIDAGHQATQITVDLAHTPVAVHEVAHIEGGKGLILELEVDPTVPVLTAVIQGAEQGTGSLEERTEERGDQVLVLCL